MSMWPLNSVAASNCNYSKYSNETGENVSMCAMNVQAMDVFICNYRLMCFTWRS